ncbi:eukaryotic translation initiation factor eIF2A-domain-containing protein [Pelagophyceae sp. CCMP2097]|nr:eukaryotic translation initiation factor eIF2A-domain-containing protein [Pelagophyceae sp. CCMP2097]|mmetsp:Transcript_28854/g.97261  ORF Transcript_28854/g.97261 Transcript_28854/m.97261 type:complete len:696 (-) Transcript_28854:63-2150(-)|eukprot:CAMPEP_0184110860 /NCGR_PEP_ID=MMETSP0974-20121125/17618_1 /TAXON_ID=483370 /ORGANISM="non described non described, Strain CCMP2097" /LENGTH=695 /DNA_ID=CAMNT_0026413937 /DNA_START=38 /DNA_END=2125 /DNA_ORIENTATION=+
MASLDDLEPAVRALMSDDEGDDFEEEPFKESYDAVIVVDNLPSIPMAKYDKLVGVLKRIFQQTGTVVRLNMPQGEGKTLGFAFVEFATAEEATKTIRLIDGYALDKSHVFRVVAFSELERLQSLAPEYVASAATPFEPRLNPGAWLGDVLHRDQFVVRYNNETEVMWAERLAQPTLEYGGEREKEGGLYWCEQYTQWSPHGSFLATFHSKGVALWGDASFSKQGRFAHNGVKTLEFSPSENFMITASPNEMDKRACIVWDLRTRKELRAFEAFTQAPNGFTPPEQMDGQLAAKPPDAKFKWSHDDKYTARRGKDKQSGDVITIYELPSMQLLDKKSLRADCVHDFEWSPKANVLCYWAPESGNTPARVTLVELPSRKELRQKNLVNVSDCRISWQSEGEYVCVKVLRHTKSRKTLFHSFELFRVNEPLVPVEMLEMKGQDVVHAFAWEPAGHRFAIVHGENSKPNVSFYSMFGPDGKKQELTHLVTLESRSCNALFWSPTGGHIVLAGVGDAYNGVLEFYDLDHKWSKVVEHYRCTHVEWDPSGRIVATSVLQPLEGAFFKFQMDNGYKLWNFQGALYHERAYENFYQFQWRPRPKSLLDAAQKKTVIKNLRKYERRFAGDDRIKDQQRQRLLTTEKRTTRANFRNLVALRLMQWQEKSAQRIAARNGFDVDDESHYHVKAKVEEKVLSSVEVAC